MDEPGLSPVVCLQKSLHLSTLWFLLKVCLACLHHMLLRRHALQLMETKKEVKASGKQDFKTLLQFSAPSGCPCDCRHDTWAQIQWADLPMEFRTANTSENLTLSAKLWCKIPCPCGCPSEHGTKSAGVQEAFGQSSQTEGWILEQYCVKPGVGLSDACGSFPTQDILSLYELEPQRRILILRHFWQVLLAPSS